MPQERISFPDLSDTRRKILRTVQDNPRPTNLLELARQFGGPTVSNLIETGHLAEVYYRGETGLSLTSLTMLEMDGLGPWRKNEDARLRHLWSEGISTQRIANTMKRPGGLVLSRAQELGLERWERRLSNFATNVMAWRVRRLRIMLIDAERRGLNLEDNGEGLLHHRALMRRFLRAKTYISMPHGLDTRKWSGEDISFLRGLRDSEHSLAVMSRVLKRNVDEIAHRLVLEGRLINGHWTEAEDKTIVDGLRSAMRVSTIATRLKHRSAHDVKIRIRQQFRTQERSARWSWAERRLLLDSHLAGYRGTALFARIPSRGGHAIRRQLYGMFKEPREGRAWEEGEVNILTRALRRKESLDDIAKWLGREPHSINDLCEELGRRRQGRTAKLNKPQIQEAQKLLADGVMTQAELAMRYGVARSTVYRSIRIFEEESNN